MRIGLFTDTYTPDVNGVVTSIVTLKQALEAKGHTVFVIANQPSLTGAALEDDVLRLPGIELKFLYGYVLSSPIHFQAQTVIREMELDIIHAHSEFGIGIFARLVSKNLHIPLVSTYHTTYEDYTHYVNFLGIKGVDRLSRKAVAKISKMYSKSTQIVIAPSEKTKQMLLGYNIQKEIAVIPTGLDLQRFADFDPGSVEAIRERYQIKDSDTLFVYIGRLAKEKSIDFVIDSFARLLQKTPAKLMIVGSGPSLDDLQEQVRTLGLEADVIFTGRVPSDEVVGYYHVADAFVSASLTETQGLTYIEALACGLCVFARPDRPLDGIIVDDETGYLFTDYDEFAEKAAAFIAAGPEKHAAIKQNALAKAATFDSGLFADAVLDVYQRSIDAYFGKYTVVSIEERDDEVILDLKQDTNHERLIVDAFVFERREIEVGMQLARNELNEIEEDQAVYDAYQRAIARIGVKDYTSFEMSNYLREKLNLTQEQIDIVIELLKKRRFIDDDRYFRDKIDYHRLQLRGNGWILDDLHKRGFETETIEAALEHEDEESYIMRGIERAERFLSTLKDGSKRQREAKLRGHLMRQGYEGETVSSIIARLTFEHDGNQEIESLRSMIRKYTSRYEKRYDDKEVRNRVVRQALNKGYDYDMIVKVLKEIEDED